MLDGEKDRTSASDYFYDGARVTHSVNSSRNGVVRGSTRLSPDGARADWRDEHGRPRVKPGTRASGLLRTLSERGRVTSYMYVDARGEPTLSSDGRYQVRAQRDETGAVIEQSYFDPAGKAMRDKHGVHRVVYTPNAMGLPAVERYFDEDGQPLANRHGVHRIDWSYDDVGNHVRKAYFGIDDLPVRNTEVGAASSQFAHDRHGNETSRTYFDESGAPTLCEEGYATEKIMRDEAGDAIQWSFLGVRGEPIQLGPNRHSIKRVKRDARGNRILERYFDAAARPMAVDGGYFAARLEYDARDNLSRVTYLDVHGQPFQTRWLYAARSHDYDGDRETWTRYWNADGEPVEIGWGYAAVRQHYDEFGARSHQQFFDVRNRTVLEPSRCPQFEDRHSDALRSALAATLACRSATDRSGSVIAVQSTAAGGLRSAAFLGMSERPLRQCLETALSTVHLPGSTAECTLALALVRFDEGSIQIFSPGARGQ